jgi:hypothetical protein
MLLIVAVDAAGFGRTLLIGWARAGIRIQGKWSTFENTHEEVEVMRNSIRTRRHSAQRRSEEVG